MRLSYKIVELFSEGLYASPNKAIEELVVNSFDARAQHVQVLLSADMQKQGATIVVIDDGDGMDKKGLEQHWLIGLSSKRTEAGIAKQKRQQIGKFGIGKLATYVLADRLTHISKRGGKYYATSMDYGSIDKQIDSEVEVSKPIVIPLRQPTEEEARKMIEPWINQSVFKESGMKLFGKKSSKSWTVTIMSSLKPKVQELKMGYLEWVLRTAMPLRSDFRLWLNEHELLSSKEGKGIIKKWILGKDLVELSRPAPKDTAVLNDGDIPKGEGGHFGIFVPGLGRITGYVEAYKDLLSGKSEEIGRSYGFFVYVLNRLVNVEDGHFGISPNELRHGTFGRFRAVVHMDGLDENLRANREALKSDARLEIAKNVLHAIFNAVRPTIEGYVEGEAPGAQLARNLAASPSSLSRMPIVDLARAVINGKRHAARNLIIPDLPNDKKEEFIKKLEDRAKNPDKFVTGLTIDYNGSADEGMVKYETDTGILRINAWHPFVATFYDEFYSKGTGQPLQLLAMAEVLVEAHMNSLGVDSAQVDDFLTTRDQLLRHLARDSGKESAFSIANSLKEARNNPDGLEDRVCAAFRGLGFEVTPFGKSGKPDGVATAKLSGVVDGKPGKYSVSLEAKSTAKDDKNVASSTVNISAIIRHRDEFKCQHAIVVGPSFQTADGENSALAKEINDDRKKTALANDPKTITLITIESLAELVKIRPIKHLGLRELRELFECRLPEEGAEWVKKIRERVVKKPPYKEIIQATQILQDEYEKSMVQYPALRVKLGSGMPSIKYETDEALIDDCKALAQMIPGVIHATPHTFELNQSVNNVIASLEAAFRDYDESYEKNG